MTLREDHILHPYANHIKNDVLQTFIYLEQRLPPCSEDEDKNHKSRAILSYSYRTAVNAFHLT